MTGAVLCGYSMSSHGNIFKRERKDLTEKSRRNAKSLSGD